MTPTNAHTTRLRLNLTLLWGTCYVAMVVAVVWSLFSAQRWAVAELSTTEAMAEWQTWREDVEQRQDRRVPKSDEPPGLVLMRDYFAVCLVGSLLFTSILYWIIAWFVTGMLRAPLVERRRGPGKPQADGNAR